MFLSTRRIGSFSISLLYGSYNQKTGPINFNLTSLTEIHFLPWNYNSGSCLSKYKSAALVGVLHNFSALFLDISCHGEKGCHCILASDTDTSSNSCDAGTEVPQFRSVLDRTKSRARPFSACSASMART